MVTKLSLLVLFSTGIYFGETIKLNNKPLKENAIKATLVHNLQDNNGEGYYQGTSLAMAPDGRYVVLDVGNKTVRIFSKEGKELKVFGKEGNGPGELSQPFRVFANNTRIFIRQDMKISIFDFEGNHIKDTSLLSGGSSGFPIFHDGKLLLTFQGNTKEKSFVINNSGEITDRVKNMEYERPEGGEQTRIMIKSSFDLVSTGDGFFRAGKGEYKIEQLDKSFNVLKTYTKEFSRHKRDFSRFQINIDDDDMTDKERKRMMARMMSNMKKRFGEYQDDVSSMLGYHKGKLFVRAANEGREELKIHVIENDAFLTEIVVPVNGEISSSRIENGKLLICAKNDDDGPMALVYNLNI